MRDFHFNNLIGVILFPKNLVGDNYFTCIHTASYPGAAARAQISRRPIFFRGYKISFGRRKIQILPLAFVILVSTVHIKYRRNIYYLIIF